MGKLNLLFRFGRFFTRNAEHVPGAVHVLNEAVIVDIPRLRFTNARVIDFYKRPTLDQGSRCGTVRQSRTHAGNEAPKADPKRFHCFNSIPSCATLSWSNMRVPSTISLGAFSPRRMFSAVSIASAPPVGY